MKKNFLMVLSTILFFILLACGNDINLDTKSPENDTCDYTQTNDHNLIGTWSLVSYTEYDQNGEFIGDLIELMVQLGYESQIRMPIVINSNGTLTWHGIPHNWNHSNGVLRFGYDTGGNYFFENGKLIIERIEFGYRSRKVLERIGNGVEHEHSKPENISLVGEWQMISHHVQNSAGEKILYPFEWYVSQGLMNQEEADKITGSHVMVLNHDGTTGNGFLWKIEGDVLLMSGGPN